MEQDDRFEPLLFIYLYKPKICLLPTTENSVLYEVKLYSLIDYSVMHLYVPIINLNFTDLE